MKILFLFFAWFFPFSSPQEEPVLQVFFSPEDHLAEKLVQYIEKEERSIFVAAYAFTHWKIAKALSLAKDRGVQVEVIIDPFSLKFSSILKKLTKSGIPIWIWERSSSEPSLMHDKFCLFGEHTVWTGSFNFTYHADHLNRENALLLRNPDIVKKFKQHFEQLRGECKRYEQKPKKS